MRGFLLAPIAGFLLAATSASALPPASEFDIKASYLFKLGPFVEWPPTTAAQPTFVICVLGKDPFGARLDRAVRDQTVRGRPVHVRRLSVVARGGGDCHILYLARPQAQTASQALSAVRGAPVLTVTDQSQGFAGGVVHFVIKEQRVRFAIDDAGAKAQGLQISSKLLSLAIVP